MDLTGKNKTSYKVTGLMSGTSLDGTDIAFCTFSLDGDSWSYSLVQAETIPYPVEWKTRLSGLENQTAREFAKTDAEYGHYLGRITKTFHEDHHLKPDFIASHGHTIFHQPDSGFTSQIGQGSAIAAGTGLPVVCDFRSADVALGGQGAPLVPIGDQLLFEKYTYCLNLGGFANISFSMSGRRIAFDICPVNIVLNYLAAFFYKDYDDNGNMASQGKLHPPLLDTLNDLEYYHRKPPKSLGKEWVLSVVHPVLQQFDIPVEDKLRTFTEHIADQVSGNLVPGNNSSLLITGGGALNSFLIQRIKEKTNLPVIIPDPLTLNFKEALIFAFLGVLCWRAEVNCLGSCTGASKDTVGGSIYRIFPK